MNQTQTQGGAAAIVAFLAGILAGRGVFGLDAATWSTILGAVLAFGAVIWNIVSTRKTAIANTLGGNGTVVVTDAATANALPNNPNVVSKDDVKVTAKQGA